MSRHDVTLTVNGTEEELSVESRTLLVRALRDDLGYTGTKVGCESSKCGACTVHLDGEPVKSCTVLAVQADGSEVTTVEGLGDAPGEREGRTESDEAGDLHPVQARFHEEHALQCGYCTPGMVMTTTALLRDRSETPSRAEIRRELKGNVCRCTGYQNVVDAVEAAGNEIGGAASTGATGGATTTDETSGGE